MQTIQDSMHSFQDVNPYELLYRNMNLHVDPTTNKETAEKIARQLGFIHNTYGVIAKDLIKLLSFVYNDQTTSKTVLSVNQKNNNVPTRFIYPSKVDQRRVQPEPMDVQEISVRVSKEPRRVEDNVKWRKKEAIIQEVMQQPKNDKKQEEAPNLDIFGEFAFEKTVNEQAKNQSKDKSQKQKISRIVQVVANKIKNTKKKDQQSNFAQASTQNKDKTYNFLQNQIVDGSLSFDKHQDANLSKQENMLVDKFNNQIRIHQERQRLEQFDRKASRNNNQINIPSQQLNIEMRQRGEQKLNQSQNQTKNDIGVVQNKLWHIMRKPQEISVVNEILISDDDD